MSKVVVPGYVENLFLSALVVAAPTSEHGLDVQPLAALRCRACGWLVVAASREEVPAHECSGLIDRSDRDRLPQSSSSPHVQVMHRT
jgi:hypothetical protein